MEKLWSECSKEEKLEFAAIKNAYEHTKKQRQSNTITATEYNNRLTSLGVYLDEIEQKYSIEQDTKVYTKCLRCGRTLKTPETKKIGYGLVCLEKKLMENDKRKLI